MKRFVLFAMSLILLLSLCACSAQESGKEQSDAPSVTIGEAELDVNYDKIIEKINKIIDDMEIAKKSVLKEDELKNFEEAINGKCADGNDEAQLYRFIIGEYLEIKIDLKNKGVKFYLNDELYLYREL